LGNAPFDPELADLPEPMRWREWMGRIPDSPNSQPTSTQRSKEPSHSSASSMRESFGSPAGLGGDRAIYARIFTAIDILARMPPIQCE